MGRQERGSHAGDIPPYPDDPCPVVPMVVLLHLGVPDLGTLVGNFEKGESPGNRLAEEPQSGESFHTRPDPCPVVPADHTVDTGFVGDLTDSGDPDHPSYYPNRVVHPYLLPVAMTSEKKFIFL